MGKVVHNDVTLLLALVPLLPAATGDAWSLDRLMSRRRAEPRPVGVAYGWPVRTAMAVVAGAYFFSGIAKLETSGLAWVTSDNLRFILYAKASPFFRPNGLSLLVADRPWLAHLVAAVAILIEAGFPVVLWRPRAALFLVPGAIALHLGIRYTLGLDYWAWIATLVALFVDWPRLADRVAAGVRAGAVTRASRLRPARGTSG